MFTGSDQDSIEYSLKYNPPMDPVASESVLKESKEILDGHGVVFLMQSGSCLGAIREKAFIQWDDDIDLASVIGINGLGTALIDTVIEEFTSRGYYCKMNYSNLNAPPYAISYSVIKNWARLDWSCMAIVEDHVYSFPGIKVPASQFANPVAIDFLGENFYVPNPPEEYLRLKYGPEWMIPKKAGTYEKDVVEQAVPYGVEGGSCRIRVLDHMSSPVTDAEIKLAGGCRFITDDQGYADVLLPVTLGISYYALTIMYPGHEIVLYEEQLEPCKKYVYMSEAYSKKSATAQGDHGTLGGLLVPE